MVQIQIVRASARQVVLAEQNARSGAVTRRDQAVSLVDAAARPIGGSGAAEGRPDGRVANDRRLVAAIVVWRRDPMRLWSQVLGLRPQLVVDGLESREGLSC